MNSISINGMNFSGNSVVIKNNKIFVDGQEYKAEDQKVINIVVNGNIDTLDVAVCQTVTVTGDVKSVRTSSGDVDINGPVNGNVQSSSGDIKVKGNIGGDVQTSSGDIECDGSISGSVKTTSGDIKSRK